MVVDRMCESFGGQWTDKPKIKAVVCSIRLNGKKLSLLKPQTYMNLSGSAVYKMAEKLYIYPDQILVAHDEMDLDFGAARIKTGGGEAGHRGLKSISGSLGTRDYMRLRIGVGRPPPGMDPADYVLRGFNDEESGELEQLLEHCCRVIEFLIIHGAAMTQNRYNSGTIFTTPKNTAS
jgi:PTH1 family peptidyl-tRNA hydrolase